MQMFAKCIFSKFNNIVFQALKAIALQRLGRYEESAATIEAVLASHPGDQTTLQACTMFFKENDDCKHLFVGTLNMRTVLMLVPGPGGLSFLIGSEEGFCFSFLVQFKKKHVF